MYVNIIENMVICKIEGCQKQAVYGYEYKNATNCSEHRINEPENLKMYNVVNKRCIICLEKRPNFGIKIKGIKNIATHCIKCKTDEMKNVNSPLCIICDETIPTYGLKGERATHCMECKTSEMIDVKNKSCIICNNKRPNYALEYNTTATHCFDCKTTDMKNVNSKLCIVCNKVQCTFGLENGVITHCAICKTDEMVDLKCKWCIVCNKVRCSFGLPTGEKTHCVTCKTDEMIDVANKLCVNCNKVRPTFGLIKYKPTHCVECKSANMIDVCNKLCIVCNMKQCSFGYKQKESTHCFDCKLTDMKNVRDNKCLTEHCDTIAYKPSYEGYCLRCFIYTFPEKPVARNYKTKETAMVNYIMERFNEQNFIWDKRIENGISLKRPDLYLDLDDMKITIECQESHHKNDNCLCINRRIMELSLDVGHKPMLSLYFNPDKYTDKDGNKIPSCWGVTPKTGILIIVDKEMWKERLKILGDTVEYWLKNRTEKTVEIIELFYDQN